MGQEIKKRIKGKKTRNLTVKIECYSIQKCCSQTKQFLVLFLSGLQHFGFVDIYLFFKLR